MKRICIYTGSNLGNKPEYKHAAILLSDVLVKNNIELIYGGSKVGLMGEIANQMLKKGAKVTGVIPKGLFPKEIIHDGLSNLVEVADMHERKKTMSVLSDGFISLPGGVGTYEELFETLSWAQLGIHQKPIGALNIAGFYEPVLALLKNTVNEGFMNESNLNLFLVSSNPDELLCMMKDYIPPMLGTKWRELKNDTI